LFPLTGLLLNVLLIFQYFITNPQRLKFLKCMFRYRYLSLFPCPYFWTSWNRWTVTRDQFYQLCPYRAKHFFLLYCIKTII